MHGFIDPLFCQVRRLIDLCQQFHIPIVTLQDEPGFMIGPEAEAAATIRYGTAFVLAAATCVVPWATVMIRKNFGVAGAGHFAPDNYVLAWPSVESGALPIEGGVAVAYRREIEAAADPGRAFVVSVSSAAAVGMRVYSILSWSASGAP